MNRQKEQIEDDIQNDFHEAYKGILKLPLKARFGVYVAYKYYFSLFKKIKRLKPAMVLEQRIRIPNYCKADDHFKGRCKKSTYGLFDMEQQVILVNEKDEVNGHCWKNGSSQKGIACTGHLAFLCSTARRNAAAATGNE